MRQVQKALRRTRSSYRVLAPYGAPHRRHLLSGGAAALVLVAARLAFPWPLRGLMEIVFHQGASGRAQGVVSMVPHVGDPVGWLIGAFVVIVLVWGVAESWQRLAFTRFAVGLSRDLRAAALKQVSSGGPRGTEAGDVIATVTGDTSKLKSGVKSILVNVSRNGTFFLGVALIVSLIDPVIGLVFLTGGLATVVAGGVGASRTSSITRRSRRREGALAHDLHLYLAGDAALDAPSTSRQQRRRPDSKVTRVEGLTTLAVHAILAAATCTILLLTIHAGRTGALSPGSVFTILAYILLMHNKTVGLGRSIVRSGRVLPSAERIAALVKRPSRAKRALAAAAAGGAGGARTVPPAQPASPPEA